MSLPSSAVEERLQRIWHGMTDITNSENKIDSLAQARIAFDGIATIRARMVTCAFIARQVLHPLPNETGDAQSMQGFVAQLNSHATALDAIHQQLLGVYEAPPYPEEIDAMIKQAAKGAPNFVKKLHDLANATHGLKTSAEEFSKSGATAPDDLVRAISVHTKAREGMFEMVTDFCAALWGNLDASRAEAAQRAEETSAMIRDTLLKLSRIGKHVKLVSLNAAVEAARAGEEGKGLSVIAVEFKTLAEEIQMLAASAHSSA